MEMVTYTIPVRSRQSDQTLIIPIGDIQWFGQPKSIALGMLKRCIAWGVERDALFLGMGDYIDAFSPSNRKRLQSAALYDTAQAVIDQKAEELVRELYEVLRPSKGKWLGLLEGHHYHQFGTGVTTDMMLADLLKTRHLGSAAYVRLMFKRLGQAGAHAVLIWCHHGVGTGQTPAAILNKLRGIATQFAGDIYLMGHLPRKTSDVIDRLEPVWGQTGHEPYLIHRTKVLASTGGYMKTWEPGSRQGLVPRGGYGEKAMYTPAALGGVLVKVTPRWKKAEGRGDVWLPDLSVEL